MQLKKILFVDDDAYTAGYNNIVMYLREVFEQRGYSFSRAFDGEEAFDFILRESPGVVVSDINMPKLTGDLLFKAIRERGLDQIIFILISNINPEDFKLIYARNYGKNSEYGERGIDAFMGKADLLKLPDLVDSLYKPK